MSTIERFEDVKAWQKARELTKGIYSSSRAAPFSKDFGLCDQARRASVSIMSNIAEGFERDGNKEFVQFLSQAKGSCGELRSQLYVALDQGYLSQEEFDTLHKLARETSMTISGFMTYLRKAEVRGRKFQ
jgi:four helix bundle protein